VNGVGYEEKNDEMCEGRDLAWLQDTAGAKVWNDWGVIYRDVIMLDADNKLVGVYNVTDQDLVLDENYAALFALMEEAAAQ
jgi:hypothetical protein